MADHVAEGQYGLHMRNVHYNTFLHHVHIGPSAVFKDTIRVETFRTLHLCPQTCRIFAQILLAEADRADRMAGRKDADGNLTTPQ